MIEPCGHNPDQRLKALNYSKDLLSLLKSNLDQEVLTLRTDYEGKKIIVDEALLKLATAKADQKKINRILLVWDDSSDSDTESESEEPKKKRARTDDLPGTKWSQPELQRLHQSTRTTDRSQKSRVFWDQVCEKMCPTRRTREAIVHKARNLGINPS